MACRQVTAATTSSTEPRTRAARACRAPSRARRCSSVIVRTVRILAPGADTRQRSERGVHARQHAGVTPAPPDPLSAPSWSLGIVVLAFNLRPAAVSVGPVLGDVRDGLGMSATETGLLTSLPVLAFAVFGALAPRLARLVGVHRLTLVALLCVVGRPGRPRLGVLGAGVPAALAAGPGRAWPSANVLLPSLVKLHFPDRVGLMTSIYSTALARRA